MKTSPTSLSETSLASFIAQKRPMIEDTLETLIPAKSGHFSQLYQAARYSLIGSGKRIRPLLTLATVEMLGANFREALQAACAIELIHTYSLIHDDLPCMDDDDFRRGKPSLHKAFNEGHAVLTGDFLLTYAFEVLAEQTQLRPDQRLALISLLAKKAGDKGMIAGQVLDIQTEGKSIDLGTLISLHQHKTGALITASIEFGAIIANASEQDRTRLRNFGDAIGLAFQIVDDILDVAACEQKHGRTVPSDVINNKTTYVTLLGIQGAQIKADELLGIALFHLKAFSWDTSILRQLAESLVHRQS